MIEKIEERNVRYRNKVSLLSFVLAVLVVLRHSVGIGVYSLDGALLWFEQFLSDATDLVVPMFFALSGFLFYQNYSINTLKSKFQSRFKTLFIPFVIWNIVGFGFVLALVSFPFLNRYINTNLPSFDLIVYLRKIFWDCEYNVTWFIRDLLIFTFLTPVFKSLLDKKISGIMILLIFISFGYYFSNGFLLYWCFYLFGTYCGLNYKKICQEQYGKGILVVSSIMLLITLITQTLLTLPQGPEMLPLRLLQIILIWISGDVFAKQCKLKWWMRISFFIYVTHSMILESVEKIIYFLLGNNSLGAIIDLLFAPVITLFVIFVLAYLLRKFSMLWAVLNGSRGA